jgi:hypothetical protein
MTDDVLWRWGNPGEESAMPSHPPHMKPRDADWPEEPRYVDGDDW